MLLAEITVIATPAPVVPVTSSLSEIAHVKARGRIDNLIGTSISASEGYVGSAELKNRPILRPGELLETVPGLVISQHSGEGKANQFYLRGFNLDHGTDISIQVQGIPANMRSHAHGQGYADVNWLIPEVIDYIHFRKGPYYAEQGDFATAGAVDMTYFNVLPKNIVSFSTGTFGQARALFAASPKIGKDAHLLYAFEYSHVDNTSRLPDNYRKLNGLLRFTKPLGSAQFGITAQAYDARWRSTDQIPLRAVQRGDIDRFGSLDPTDGGRTHRYVLSSDFSRETAKTRTKIDAYLMDYSLDLFSNFTYGLSDPINGDQFQQSDRRFVVGVNASHTWKTPVAQNTIGYQMRNDNITPVALNLTKAQSYLSTVRSNRVTETSNAFYVQSAQQLNRRLRMTTGLRGDVFQFRVNDARTENSGNVSAAIVSPKLHLHILHLLLVNSMRITVPGFIVTTLAASYNKSIRLPGPPPTRIRAIRFKMQRRSFVQRAVKSAADSHLQIMCVPRSRFGDSISLRNWFSLAMQARPK